MKYIIAPTNASQAVITPDGEAVVFENGVATEFSDEQEEFFEEQEAYTLSDELVSVEDQEIVEDEPATDEESPLPVLQDKLKDMLAFAELNDVDLADANKRSKQSVLDAIYAHFEE